LATSATFLGILGARMGYPILDPLASIIISGFIAKMAFEILMEATGQIMDESADENKIKEIEEIAEGVKGVVNAYDIRMRRSGSVYLIDMDIVVPSYYTIKEAHDVCELVREKIFEDIDNTKEVIVHIDPS
jgi:cation diffusion facilitator family transporter